MLREAELWPAELPLRASVSAMGFGGINAHVVLEGTAAERRSKLSPHERQLAKSGQDAELFLLAAATSEQLLSQTEKILALAEKISRAELVDLAAQLEKTLKPGMLRAAVIAATPAELVARLQTLLAWLRAGVVEQIEDGGSRIVDGSAGLPPSSILHPPSSPQLPTRIDFANSVFLGSGKLKPRIGFLFPGQGSPTHLDGGLWRRRFDSVRELYERAALPADGDDISTRVMQPAVVTASLAGLSVLNDCGLTAQVAVGHSLGEFTALHWSGALEETDLLRLAQVRGAAMADLGSPTGAMVAIEAPWLKVKSLLNGHAATIVGYNSPKQTVVAGESADVNALARSALAHGWPARMLPVSHAFHTALVSAAVPVLAEHLAQISFAAPERLVISTVTGQRIEAGDDLRELLCRQVTSPVRFERALRVLLNGGETAGEKRKLEFQTGHAVDLLIEVGPGQVLSGLVRETVRNDWPFPPKAPLTRKTRSRGEEGLGGEGDKTLVVSLDAGGPSVKGLLEALGAAFVLGAPLRTTALFADRFVRPFDLNWKPKFFANPCELAPLLESGTRIEDGELKIATNAQRHPPSSILHPQSVLTPLELIRQLVAERAELPVASIRDESRMLSDLHLNSISVGQLVSESARRLGLPRIIGLTDFANASVAEIARALDELKQTGGAGRADDHPRQPPGVDHWVRSFTAGLVRAKGRRQKSQLRSPTAGAGWRIFAPKEHPLAAQLTEKFAATESGGVLLCLPERPGEEHIALLLEAGRAVASSKTPTRFVLVQHGWGGAGFARTLHLETPALTTCVVNVPPAHPRSLEWIVAEAAAATGYTEAHYDAKGQRWEPRLQLNSSSFSSSSSNGNGEKNSRTRTRTKDEDEEQFPIGAGDVLLVTGGGKGIAAECALALGRETGARLALLGRSDAASDKTLAENLARIRAAGVRCDYARADVTDATAVRKAVAGLEKKLGPVTAVLHGAGTNTPQLISALDEAAFRQTVAPKIDGVRNVLAAVDARRLKLLVTFGSIIARAGLRGEADYATANEWLTAFTEEFQADHPHCRCLALEWSVWSGVGMGERLGRMETLLAHGITPIPPDEGVRILLESLRRPQPAVALVVTGRFGEPPTLKLDEPELPLRRFLERKRAHYPGVELIVDVALSVAADPYLGDHIVQKEKLFPAVLGLEAMAQAAMALVGSTTPPSFEKLELTRPIAVSDEATTTIRIAALRRSADVVEVCVRSEETDFHVDHFRAQCLFGATAESDTTQIKLSPVAPGLLPLDPATELYGGILFHTGRFARVRGYRLLKAKECVAEISADPEVEGGAGTGAGLSTLDSRHSESAWFGPYLPAEFVLGNPGARDAALHAIQACVPHRRILPTGIDRVMMRRVETGARLVRARERSRVGNDFVYDVEITDANGEVVERWEGLKLRAVANLTRTSAWPEPLIGPYLERRLEELIPQSPVKVVLDHGGQAERPARSDAAIQNALGHTQRIWRRPDGKPVTADAVGVSVAHVRELTLAVATRGGVGCDVEEVTARTGAIWNDLLGREGFHLAELIANEHAESLDTAATRLWTARECMKKAGLAAQAPLVLESSAADGWATLRSGSLRIASGVVAVRSGGNPLAVAVALEANAATQDQSRVSGLKSKVIGPEVPTSDVRLQTLDGSKSAAA